MKPENSETKIIDGATYHVKRVSTRDGLFLGARLLNLVSNGVGGFDASVDDLMAGKVPLNKIVAGVLGSPNLAKDVIWFCDQFAALTEVEWTDKGEAKSATLSNVFDAHFGSDYERLARWLVFCVTVNLSGFLGVFGIKVKL